MVNNKPPLILAASPDALSQAAKILRAGGLVAVPTETVYGLAARADSDEAVAAIYHAKGRPAFNPLIVHIADLSQAEQLAEFDSRALALANIFWPGALTLVLPLKTGANVVKLVTAGLPTIALRCPAHPDLRAILMETGLPLAAPSANRSNGVSPSCAAHVAESLGGRVGLILDGGPCEAGIESTIIAIRSGGSWQILRHGPISEAQIAEILGSPADIAVGEAAKIEAPGQLASHYSPGKPVRLDATQAAPDEFHIGFDVVAGDVTLSASGDLMQAAARLYACLHDAAAAPQKRIAVAPIPNAGIGVAINDRLQRAAI